MATRIIKPAVSLLAFLIPYYGISVLMAWVDVYVLGHWDGKFGQDGSFYLSIEITNYMAVVATTGHIAGYGIAMACGMERSLVRMSIVAVSAGVMSSGSLWGLTMIDAAGPLGGIILVYIIGGPIIWTGVLSWMAAKTTRREAGITDAA